MYLKQRHESRCFRNSIHIFPNWKCLLYKVMRHLNKCKIRWTVQQINSKWDNVKKRKKKTVFKCSSFSHYFVCSYAENVLIKLQLHHHHRRFVSRSWEQECIGWNFIYLYNRKTYHKKLLTSRLLIWFLRKYLVVL